MPQALMRKPVDFDWVCTQEEYERWVKDHSTKVSPTKMYSIEANNTTKHIVEGITNCEFEIIKEGTSSALLKELVEKDEETMDAGVFGLVPSLPVLLAIKDSHKFKKFETSVGCAAFWKTAIDWHAMKRLGVEVKPAHREFIKLRSKETYTHKLPNLMASRAEFFNEAHGVHYEFDHDSLHESQKHLDKPAYLYYAQDGQPVFSDKDKFFACSNEIRIYGAIEEGSVLALERAILPDHEHKMGLHQAWTFALAKICTTITSGFFRQWCFENVFDIVRNYPADYYEKFQKGLETGIVKRIDQANKIAS
jgi:hypothetical protein